MKKGILFFRIWPDPPIAKSVTEMMVKQFPEYKIEIIDVWKLIKEDKHVMVLNLYFLVKEYWSDILFKSINPKPAFFRTTYLFRYIKGLAKKKSAQKTNIVFTFQLQSIFDTSVPGIPNYVYTDHTHLANLWYSEPGRVKLYSAEWIGLEKSIYTNAAFLFTRSTNISKSLTVQYGISEQKVKCVFAGSNAPVPTIEPVEKDYTNQIILFVGMDWKRKGGPALVEAFKKICNDHPKAILKIIGCDPKINHPQIKVLGKLPLSQLSRHYESASIFCMPSINEPFGVVFVEAMAYGLPIIATSTGAIPDMVIPGKNGILIDVGDIDALAKALGDLLSDQNKRRQFGKQSYLMSKNLYNWQTVGEKIRNQIHTQIKAVTS
jgi:glycosyltransferase involved in cell wall biosynthesis